MKLLTILASSALLPMSEATTTHPGGLNAEACHTNRKTDDHHCRRGGRSRADPAQTQSFSSHGLGPRIEGAFANCAAALAAVAAPSVAASPATAAI